MRSPTDSASAPNTASTPLPSRDNAALAALAPWPDPQANKYTRGKLSLVAGAAAYPGAACLAGAAAERAGAGYTEVFCAGESLLAVRSFRPSLVVHDWREWHPARQEARCADRTGACVIGCGFDGDARQRELVAETVRAATGPVLIDGGAIGLMADKAGQRLARERAERGVGPLVLTPHGGEAARLARGAKLEGALGGPELAAGLARAYRALIVRKGPITFIADAEGIVETMDRGTAALAKAGTGDVLAGIIGGLLAQGLAPRDAAALGCALHAEAGRAAAQELTEICVSAEDVIAALPQAVRAIVGAH